MPSVVGSVTAVVTSCTVFTMVVVPLSFNSSDVEPENLFVSVVVTPSRVLSFVTAAILLSDVMVLSCTSTDVVYEAVLAVVSGTVASSSVTAPKVTRMSDLGLVTDTSSEMVRDVFSVVDEV